MLRCLAAVLILPCCLHAQTPTVAPEDARAVAVVAPEGEPGSPLVISGFVYAADGRTPLRNASIYVYQTDARGYYAPNDPRASATPRLHAYMRTDASGRYEFRTIRPGSYPGTNNPGHIHYHVNASGHSERVFEIVFDDDKQIPARWREEAKRANSFVAIVALQSMRDGTLRGTQNVTLRAQ